MTSDARKIYLLDKGKVKEYSEDYKSFVIRGMTKKELKYYLDLLNANTRIIKIKRVSFNTLFIYFYDKNNKMLIVYSIKI